jgi:excinuclease ABC subunit B
VQTIGRAARNADGHVIMYADHISDAMKEAIDETHHRRIVQMAFNKEHHITPKTIVKAVQDIIKREDKEGKESLKENFKIERAGYNLLEKDGRKKYVKALEKQMLECAKNLQYEQAAAIRDEIERITNGDLNGTKIDGSYQFPFA